MLSEPQPPNGGAEEGSIDALRARASRKPMAVGGARITADSFKLLTERLKRKPGPSPAEASIVEAIASEVPAAELPPAVAAEPPPAPAVEEPLEAREEGPEPEAVSEVTVTAAFPEFSLPAFAPLQIFALAADAGPAFEPEPESANEAPPAAAAEVTPEAGDELPVSISASDIVVLEEDRAGEEPMAVEDVYAEVPEPAPLPEFAPVEIPAMPPVEHQPEPQPHAEILAPYEELAPLESQPTEPVEDSAAQPVAPLAEDFEEPNVQFEPEVVAADEPEPVIPALEPAVAELAPQPTAEAGETKHVSAVTGKVVDAMLKTISDSVYAKPSAADRAAFLRDMAELMMQEAANISPQPAPNAVVAALAPAPAPVAPAAPLAASAPPAKEAPPVPLNDAIAARIGPATALLRNSGGEPDPFAKDASTLALNDPKPTETVGADEETGDLALTLLAMMSSGAGTALPQERALAADTLLRILPRIPVKQLLAVVERVAIMQAPPPLLVAKLIRDQRPEVVAPLLERCMHITDQDLMTAASEGDVPKQRMIARRRAISPLLADHLIALGDPSVVLTLIRNPAAAFSHDAFHVLAELASQHHGLLAPLATRADLPPPVAFELFWHVPQELRRFIFSRFLTDSETLNKILRITLATHGGAGGEGDGQLTETKFPDREVIDGAIAHAADFRLDEAARVLGEVAGISKDTAMRILADREGEPLTVILKALGYPRGKFSEAMERLRTSEAGIVRRERVVDELQGIFDSLSFNKARILLTYWDWFVRKAGPYAPRH